MPNKVKNISDGSELNSLHKGNWAINISPNDIGEGPTSSTGLYNGAKVPEGGYVIYSPVVNNGNGVNAFVAENDDVLISYIRELHNKSIDIEARFPSLASGITIRSKSDALNWVNTQDSIIVLDRGMPSIVTDGLVQYFDASNINSFIDNQPTTNLNANPSFTNGTTGWSFASWDGKIGYSTTTSMGPFGIEVPVLQLMNYSPSSYSHFHQYNNGKYTTGNQYTQSAWVKGFGTLDGRSHWGGNVSFTLTGEWQYVSYTVTATTSSSSNFPYWAAEGIANGSVLYMVDAQSELGTGTPFVDGTRSQNIAIGNLGLAVEPQYYTLYGITYPESSYAPANRQGITAGYNNISSGKIYDASRDMNYYVFNEADNTWVPDSYFNGERTQGHCYDTYDGQPDQWEQFNRDFDAIHVAFPNATHIIIASHAAERFWTNSGMLTRLKSFGLPDTIAGRSRPEFILAGKVNKPHTFKFTIENINSAVVHMNLMLPIEDQFGELTNSPGYLDGAIVFDGANDKIQTSLNTPFNDFSVSIAFKDNGSGAWGRLADKHYGSGFFVSSYFATYGQGYVGAGVIEPSPPHGIALPYDTSRWHFFTSVRNGSEHTIYLDGVEQKNSKTVSIAPLNYQTISFGCWDSTISQLFKGSISKTMIYDKALSTNEILQNYYNGPIVTDGLIRALDFSNKVCYELGNSNGYDLTGNDTFDLYNVPTPISTFGGGISFSETNEFLALADLIATNYVTVECWYTRRGGSSSEDIIFNKENTWELKDDGGNLQWAVFASNQGWFWQATGATIGVGETAHIVLSYNGNQVKFHKNGVLIQTYSYPAGGVLANQTSAYPKLNARGSVRTSASNPGNHDFYQFRIYDRALSDSEILQNYNAHKSIFGF